MRGAPRGFGRALVGAVLAMTVTGLLLAPGALFSRWELDTPFRLPGAWRTAAAAAHVLSGLAAIFLFGAVWAVHIRPMWRTRLRRPSGLALVATVVFLGLSGLGNLYLSGELAAAVNSMAHLGAGLALPGAVLVHVVRRRSRAASAEPMRRRPRDP